jgi:hypothetical protein
MDSILLVLAAGFAVVFALGMLLGQGLTLRRVRRLLMEQGITMKIWGD